MQYVDMKQAMHMLRVDFFFVVQNAVIYKMKMLHEIIVARNVPN